jgi:flagella basal body P-ring formation protein FlgA
MRRIASISVCWVLALASGAAAQHSITLRPVARISAGAPVRLGDVAEVAGPRAEELAAYPIMPSAAAGAQRVSPDELRAMLAGAELNWSGTTLSGAFCEIIAAKPVERKSAPVVAAPAAEAAVAADSVRAALTGRIAAIVAAEPTDLRLTYSEQDAEVLSATVGGRTLEVRTVGTSERMALGLTLYEGDRIVLSKTIRVGVEVRRRVALAAGPKRRGEVLTESDVTVETQWLPPGVVACPPERAIGAAVRNRLAPGELITEADLAPPVVVEKGDQVMVRCVSGGVVVAMRARALTDAKDGEIVQLQSVDRPGSTFEARMEGRGRAVLLATQAKKTRKESK